MEPLLECPVAPSPATVARTSSATDEWYTPRRYVEAARRVLGGIDLDPASCERANRTVQARKYFTEADDGLKRRWHGDVWCNPPYGWRNGKSNQALWSRKFLLEHHKGRMGAGILLVNCEPASSWFGALWEVWTCLTDHRIRFVDEHGVEQRQPTHGNCFAYAGPYPEIFASEFSRFGRVIPPLPVAGQGLLL